MIIAISKYLKPLNELDAYRPAHLEFLKKLIAEKKVLLAGRQNPAVGGVVLANLASVAELQKILEVDPFTTAGLAEYQFVEFNPVVFDEVIKGLMPV